MTCAHRGSTASAPSRDAMQERHCAGGSPVLFSSGSGTRSGPDGRAARPACVLAALPLGLLPRAPRLLRPDRFLRTRRARVPCCPSTAAAPPLPAAAPAAATAPGPRQDPPAVPRSPRPLPPARPSAGRSQREAPRHHPARAHQARSEACLKLQPSLHADVPRAETP